MSRHEFGIIDEISKSLDEYENYEPEKYNCISVDDEFIEPLIKEFNELDTYFHNLSCPQKGLAYCGITLIPPTSLVKFKLIIDRYDLQEMKILSQKIEKAMKKNKFMIHYGI